MLKTEQRPISLQSSAFVVEFDSYRDNHLEIFVSPVEPLNIPKELKDFLKNKVVLFPRGVDIYAKIYDPKGNAKTINLSDLNDSQADPVELSQIEFPDTQTSLNNFVNFNCEDANVAGWIYNQCFPPKRSFKDSMVQGYDKFLTYLPSKQGTKSALWDFWNLSKSVFDVRKFFVNQASVKTLPQDSIDFDELDEEAILQVISSKIERDGFITRPNLLGKLPRELKRHMECLSLDLYQLQNRIVTTYKKLSNQQKIELYHTLSGAMGEKVGGDYGAKATPHAKRTDYEAAYSRFQELLRNRFLSVVLTVFSLPVSIWQVSNIFSIHEEEESSSTMQQIDLIINVVLATMPIISSVLTSNAHQELKVHAEGMRQSWNQFYQNIDTKLKPFERAAEENIAKVESRVEPAQQSRINQRQTDNVLVDKIEAPGQDVPFHRTASWPLLSAAQYQFIDKTSVTNGLSKDLLEKLPSRITAQVNPPVRLEDKEKLARKIINQYYTLAVHIGANMDGLELDNVVDTDQEYLVKLQNQGVNVEVVTENLDLLNSQVPKEDLGHVQQMLELIRMLESLIERISNKQAELYFQVEDSSLEECNSKGMALVP